MVETAWNLTHERLVAMLELDHDLFLLLDKEFRIVWQSPSVQRVLGHAAGELVGTCALALVYTDDVAALDVIIRSLVEEPGAATRVRFKVRHVNGSWRSLEASVQHRQEPGESILLLAASDVTERHQLELQLRAAQRMETVGRLAAGVAHDFNNLLTAMMGNAELLLLDVAADDPRREELDEILSAGRRATVLTRQLLAFSRQRTQHLRTVRPADLVLRLSRILERVIGEDVILRVEAAPMAACVRVDPAQFEEILMNLAVNARDAMPVGGTLTFSVQRQPIAQTDEGMPYFVPPGDYVAIRVRDTGIGMAPDVIGRIFEPFFTTKGPDRGTGLGLSTAYGIVKQSGGFIWAESTLGSGSVFHLLLPESAGPPDDQEQQPRLPVLPSSSGHVFFVEDDPSVRRFGVKTLELAGFQVSAFGAPEQALAAFTAVASTVDLLLLDVVMPGMSGPELAAACTAVRPLPVVYLSGYSRDVLVQHGLANEPRIDLLSKPLAAEELVRALRSAIQRRA